MSKRITERRYLFGTDAEVRAEDGENGPRIIGHAAVFDAVTTIYGRFRETVRRGAFTKTIGEADIRALFNHDPNYVLGRNHAKTLVLEETDKGLRYAINAPDTQLVRDLVLAPLGRGDVSGSSFSFNTIKDREENELRELLELKLFDVGPVTFPAYAATDSQLRDAILAAESAPELELVVGLRAGGLTDPDLRAMFDRAIELLEPEEESPCDDTPLRSSAERRLQLAESEMN